MGWTLYTLELLRKIPGLELTVLDSQCCGIAGTYGFKKENYPTLTSHRRTTVPSDRRKRRRSGGYRLRNLQMAD
ncbi:sn-glycerol-3-phosphate dehydrogenase (Anaerobic), K-small subunit [Escherichia coli]|nr:sn-glycerol-3-phosphate dehydrogenase (Anaerobic), K-small subunit [Escherichia coli]